MTRKKQMKNGAVQLYNEALKEADEKESAQMVKRVRIKLEEIIDGDKDAYLMYKAKWSVDNPIISVEGIISLVVATIGVIIAVLSLLNSLIGQCIVAACIVSAVGMLLCIGMLFRLFHAIGNVPKCRLVSDILGEIGREKFGA